MSAGISDPRYYADYDDEEYLDEPEMIFENNRHGQAVESFQSGRFYRQYNGEPTRPTGTFRPNRTYSETYAYTLPGQVTAKGGAHWPQAGQEAEAVYAYSSDEPHQLPGQSDHLKEQVQRLGDDLFREHRSGVIIALAIFLLLICGGLTWLNTFGRADSEGEIYRFNSAVNHTTSNQTGDTTETKPQGLPPAAATGAHAVSGAPTITVAKISQVLKQYNSPAVAASQAIYDLGVKYGIDPAYALAFFIHESSAGTKGIAVTTKSLGNIRQTANSGFEGYQGFRKYPTWEAGAEDWYKLIKNLYIDGWNLPTVEKIIPKYAPAEDNNNPTSYINAVNSLVDTWRSGK